MRRLYPFIFTILLFGIAATETVRTATISLSAFQEPDSMKLFRDITDISRQIEKRTQSPDRRQRQDLQLPLPVSYDSLNLLQIMDSSRYHVVLPLGDSLVYRNPLDSLYPRKENGTLQLPDSFYNADAMRGLTFRDTLFYNPLFLPVIFNGKILPRNLSFYPVKKEDSAGILIPREKTFAPALAHADFVQRVRMNYYKQYPDRVKYSVFSFDSIPPIADDEEIVRATYNPFRELLKAESAYSLDAPDIEGAQIDRKFWVYSGEHSFQFAQNYFSNNWHKGGTNNLNFNSYQALRVNYRKEKVRFNNLLEWRLSVFNAPDDTLRRYRVGEDLIRYYGDFGVDAFLKGWSYSMNLEVKSQFFNTYPTNSNNLLSAFLSPLYVNAGVGLKFNLDKRSEKMRHRRIKWDLSLSPASINYKYVGNESVDVKRYGIPEGSRSVLDFGSTVTSILRYDITRYITWDSRLTYFTSYDKVVSEFENSLNMALTNAFSTRIYLNVRFDDDVPPDPELKYWQINQTLSFGFNYKW